MLRDVRVRAVLVAMLVVACAVLLLGRAGGPAAPDCAPGCPVASIVAVPDDVPLPCLRDPACGGGFSAAFALLAVLGYRLRLGRPPFVVLRRPGPPRTHARRGFGRPPSRPPAG